VCAGQDEFVWECFVYLGYAVHRRGDQRRACEVTGRAGLGAEWREPPKKGCMAWVHVVGRGHRGSGCCHGTDGRTHTTEAEQGTDGRDWGKMVGADMWRPRGGEGKRGGSGLLTHGPDERCGSGWFNG
jgi:hypothetical protein